MNTVLLMLVLVPTESIPAPAGWETEDTIPAPRMTACGCGCGSSFCGCAAGECGLRVILPIIRNPSRIPRDVETVSTTYPSSYAPVQPRMVGGMQYGGGPIPMMAAPMSYGSPMMGFGSPMGFGGGFGGGFRGGFGGGGSMCGPGGCRCP